jgi:uncharacterized membrane protein
VGWSDREAERGRYEPSPSEAAPPSYAEGTYDHLNFENPGQPLPGYHPAQPHRVEHHAAGHELYEDEPSHGHAHGGGSSAPVSARTRRAVIAILAPAILATLVGLVLLWPGHPKLQQEAGGQQERASAEVTQVVEKACPKGADAASAGITGPCGTATVHITGGVGKGQTVSVELPQGPGSPSIGVGDKVVLLVVSDGTGTDAGTNTAKYSIVDKQRANSLWLLAALTAVVVIAFGRLRGLAAIGGLILSFVILLFFILPAILNGSPPLLVAVVGSSAIMFAVLYLTHGVSVHTSVAILGTLASLVLTGLLGAGFTSLAQLTGIGDEQSIYLTTAAGGVDVRGLLLAGIIIGALGVLDDVTVTQAEMVAELAVHPRTRLDLYRAAIRVGRAHVGSAVNTIVLAYAGASLPLLLLLSVGGQSISSQVTGQSIASEIVRSLVGTIGLVAAVPITTGLAVLVAEPPEPPELLRAE